MTQIRSLKHVVPRMLTRRIDWPIAKLVIMMLPLRLSPRKRAAIEW